MDENGVIRDSSKGPEYIDSNLTEEHAVKMFRTMARLSVMDNIFLNAQRQGRISFYMSSQVRHIPIAFPFVFLVLLF